MINRNPFDICLMWYRPSFGNFLSTFDIENLTCLILYLKLLTKVSSTSTEKLRFTKGRIHCQKWVQMVQIKEKARLRFAGDAVVTCEACLSLFSFTPCLQLSVEFHGENITTQNRIEKRSTVFTKISILYSLTNFLLSSTQIKRYVLVFML